MSNSLEAYQDAEKLLGLDLIVPLWTMGQIEQELVNNVSAAVQSGVGLAGCHGGMCDAFRNNVDWQFMTGGQWVAHPGNDGVEYMVNMKRGSSPLLDHIEDFQVKSEQYYLHVDPAVEVLATTRFPVVPGPHSANGLVDMPVVWTKRWGNVARLLQFAGTSRGYHRYASSDRDDAQRVPVGGGRQTDGGCSGQLPGRCLYWHGRQPTAVAWTGESGCSKEIPLSIF